MNVLGTPPAPWQEIGPARPNPGPYYLWVSGEQSHEISLDGLRVNLQQPPEPENPRDTEWVVRPGGGPVQHVAEVSELQGFLLEGEERFHLDQAREHRFAPWILVAMVGAVLASGALGALPLGMALALMAGGWGLGAFRTWLSARLALCRLARQPEVHLRNLAAEARFAVWLGRVGWRDRLLAWGLPIVWGVIFLVQLYAGRSESVALAGLVKPEVRQGDWLRLLTGPMLHGSVAHLLMNAGAWFGLALLAGRLFHRGWALAAWFAGALGGSGVSLILTPQTPSVGASGGLCGLLGLLLALGWQRRALLPPAFLKDLLSALGFMALFGVLAWALIDHGAHAGGLLAGFLVGVAVLAFQDRVPLPDSRDLRLLELAGGCAFLALAGCTLVRLLP